MSAARTIVDSGIHDWTPDRLPDLTGKSFVITGGNSGLGLAAAKLLAKRDADILIACRSEAKAMAAAETLRRLGQGSVDFVRLDLADLTSVRAAAPVIAEHCPHIDALIANAGVMQTPKRKTADGFELQFGTNHLGHFLLSGLLLPHVEAAGGRFAILSSLAHHGGRLHFDNLMLERGYAPMKAYMQSKLANLMFALELNRRLAAKGSAACAIACHPGWSATNLQITGPSSLWKLIYVPGNALLAQSADQGAYPTVLAAAGTQARRGAYYGPTDFGGLRGRVGDAKVARRALDGGDAARLWRESEELVELQWL